MQRSPVWRQQRAVYIRRTRGVDTVKEKRPGWELSWLLQLLLYHMSEFSPCWSLNKNVIPSTFIFYTHTHAHIHNILLIHPSLMDTWVVSMFWLLWVMLLCTGACNSWHILLGHCVFFLLIAYMIGKQTSSPSWLFPFLPNALMIVQTTFCLTLDPESGWSGHGSLTLLAL